MATRVPTRVLVAFGSDGASSIVRGLVYRPKLQPPRFRADFVALYHSPLTRLRERAAAPSHPLVRRLTTAPVDVVVVGLRAALAVKLLATAHRYDRIILIKDFDSRFIAALRGVTRAQILYDMDDAIWLPAFLGPDELPRVLRLVDGVACDNAYLRDYASLYNAHAFVLRGPVELVDVPPRARATSMRPVRPIIGWIGSPSTLHYLDRVLEPLHRVAAALPNGLEFRVVGGGHDRARWPRGANGLTISVVPHYDEAEMLRQLGEIDIGLFPLNDDDSSRGRGVLKATRYMSAGVPAVCSAIGELPSFLQHGVDGLVCATADDWVAALTMLCVDEPRRRAIGKAGRERIRREFSLDHCFGILDREFLSREPG